MSRRKPTEMAFGSDSFLDVITNMVGILIILIVIAGMRVREQAQNSAEVQAASESAAASAIPAESEPVYVPPLPTESVPAPILAEAIPNDPATTAAIFAASEPYRPSPIPIPKAKPRPIMPGYVPPAPVAILPSRELENAIAKSQADLKALAEKSSQAGQSEKRLTEWNADLSKQIASARTTLQQGWDDASAQKQKLHDLKRTLDRTQVTFIGKQQELTAAEKQKPPTESIRHQLTPVSRVVEGNEIHFHVKENRVAYVPLMELVEKMKPQIQRQREWLLKYHEHRGRVGPYRGFQLDYVVVRQRLNAIEEARNGSMARVLPVLLKFEPQEELIRESLDEALRPGSVYIRELQMADVNTTLTFWVYPDSYGTYRQLKEFAHAEGFTVAARPLQEGDSITASPFGSKSSGQ